MCGDLFWIWFRFLIQFGCLDTGENGFGFWLQGKLKFSFGLVIPIFLAWNVLWIDYRACRSSFHFVLRNSYCRNSFPINVNNMEFFWVWGFSGIIEEAPLNRLWEWFQLSQMVQLYRIIYFWMLQRVQRRYSVSMQYPSTSFVIFISLFHLLGSRDFLLKPESWIYLHKEWKKKINKQSHFTSRNSGSRCWNQIDVG